MIDLPPFASTYRQLFLFDCEAINQHAARNWVGDFFMQATAAVSPARRYKDSCKFRICPDLQFDSQNLFEVKGVGRSNASILYQGRLKKDRELVNANRIQLHYWFWRHKHAVTESATKQQLRENLAAATYQVLVVNFEAVEQYCLSRPVKVLNTAYTRRGLPLKYGSTEKGYGYGWTVSMRHFLEQCPRRLTLPAFSVYGCQLQNVEVFTAYESQELLFHANSRNTKG